VSELVTGVGLCDGFCAGGDEVSGEPAGVLWGGEEGWVETELGGEGFVEDEELWLFYGDREGGAEEEVREILIGVVPVPSGVGWIGWSWIGHG